MSKFITVSHSGSFSKSEKFFKRMQDRKTWDVLRGVCEKGLHKLESATPKDTGKTAQSWEYNIEMTPYSVQVYFNNTNVTSGGVPVVILIQYGHGTRNGAYVQGNDFINPVMRPIFDEIANTLWKEVTR